MKKEIKRMKKQPFGVKRKRKQRKSRRQRRSFFPSFIQVDRIFGQSEGINVKQGKERTERPPAKQKSKVNTLLEIARKRANDIPSDFFQVVTSSDIKHSPFSGHKASKIVNRGSFVENKADEKKDYKNRNRNYKRQKLLFNSPNSQSWAGTLPDLTGLSCPAYLITPRHALTYKTPINVLNKIACLRYIWIKMHSWLFNSEQDKVTQFINIFYHLSIVKTGWLCEYGLHFSWL